MQKEMKTLAKAHKFEEAGVIRNQLFTLKHIQDVSLIKEDPAEKGRTFLDAKGSTFGSRIEAYDIAHLAGKHMVGVMTVIENGEANKNEYRKFKIRNFKDANDPGALLEILERRFNHAEWRSPNLIVVDGGKAQLNAAKKFEDRVGLKIPVMAVVKDERHRPKGILGDQKIARKYEREILLANNEAHRFAIKYHRDLARKLLTK
jgi:excinuclease ABC subunit C